MVIVMAMLYLGWEEGGMLLLRYALQWPKRPAPLPGPCAYAMAGAARVVANGGHCGGYNALTLGLARNAIKSLTQKAAR